MRTSFKSIAHSAIIFCALMGFVLQARAYDFADTCASGQVLYYKIIDTTNHTVSVTHPGTSVYPYSSYTQPTGVLTIPNTVTYNATPYSVTSIGDAAFYYCSGLTSVTFGDSVASIGDFAFRDCTAILSVTSNAVVAPILDGDEVFSGFDPMTPLFIPQGSRDSYVARGWDNYFDIKEQSSIARTSAADYTVGTDDMRIVVRGAEGQRIRIYDNMGRLLSNTQSVEDVRVFNMPATGIYMVQVDNDPAHRVVLVH